MTDEPGAPAGQPAQPGTPAASNPQTDVLGGSLTNTPEVAGATLPRTGTDPTGLLAAGLWSLSVGGLALALGRHRRRSS